MLGALTHRHLSGTFQLGRMLFRFVLSCLLLTGSSQAAFRAGVSFRVVTPKPLLPISGGMGPSAPARSQQGELTVRALAMDQDGTQVVIVSADFLGFPAALGNRVRLKVSGIPGDHILIGATHTHSAPDLYAFPDGKGGTSADLKYLDQLVQQTAETIQDALRHMHPVSIRIATGQAQGAIAYNYYAPDLYDPRVNVVQFLREDGKPTATLVNYAIHPEVLGNRQGICSPDLVGPLYDRIADQGGGMGIFMNSAQGGMVTADNRRPNGQEANDWAECQRIGRLLADESLRVIDSAPIQMNPGLYVASHTIQFPVESGPMLAVMRGSPLGYTADAQGRISTTVNLVNLGTAQILTIPGEALPNIGYYLKRKMKGKQNLLFGLTNDAFGYILTPVDWNSFHRYEYITRTSLGERTGDIYIQEALEMVSKHPAP